MKRKQLSIFCLILAALFLFAGCSATVENNNGGGAADEQTVEDHNVVDTKTADIAREAFTLTESADGSYTYASADGKTATLTVECTEGTNHYTVEGNTLSIDGLTENTVFELSGVFYGNILVEIDDDIKLELVLKGLTIYSYDASPILVSGGDKVTISAKKETQNLIFDLRDAVGEEDISAAIYTTCDLDIQGKGELYVTSENNNGVHTKDDLKVKNLTLQVDCRDNALKGNDSVTIESGTITLIARSGDGIKTSNSELSSKGKQKGTISILDGDILIYAASDGIDAAYNVEIAETSSLSLQIFTGRYSKYTESAAESKTETTLVNTATLIDTATSSESGLGARQSGRGSFGGFGGNSGNGGFGGNLSQLPEGSDGSFSGELPEGFGNSLRGGGQQGGMPGGNFGGGFGMTEGNSDKSDDSEKGIKADNEIVISGGAITISSYDDAIHANNDEELENGETPVGNVSISGGNILVSSNDDGVHADGTLTISGGSLSVTKSYEGLEGNIVVISGGDVSVIASDDGVNAKTKSGTGIEISGGKLYVYATGDGLDSNSTTQYGGILFSGGETVVISKSGGNSAIDSERGYRYTGGKVIAIGSSGGMSSESVNCQNFSSVGTSKTISLQSDSYLTVSGFATVKLPTSLNALVVVLGSSSAGITSSSTASGNFDANGVAWNN